LNASTKALSVGLPDREKSIFAAMTIGPKVHRLTGELAAVVTERHFRHTPAEFQPLQGTHNIISFRALSSFYGYGFSYVHIYHGQSMEPGTILQLN